MVNRGKDKARNKFFKFGSPLIESGDMAGRRDTERITARIQVIPDGAFGMFGERKINGFTLSELRAVAEGGDPVVVRDDDGGVTAYLALGSGLDEWTKDELYEIIDTVAKEGGPFLTESPMDVKDLERERLKNPAVVVAATAGPAPEAPKKRGRPPKAEE